LSTIFGYFPFPWLGRRYAAWHRLITLNMIRSAGTDSMLGSVSPPTWMDQYTRHNAAVRQLTPPDQLLVFHVGEGWERLCAFLGIKRHNKMCFYVDYFIYYGDIYCNNVVKTLAKG
jgi:hypothetical protein